MVLFYDGCASTASREEPLRGGSYRYILGISILKLTAKTEYAKHVVRNITFSEATGQDHNITGQTASEQVLFYLNVHLFATIVSINGIWKVGDRWGGGVYTPAAPY